MPADKTWCVYIVSCADGTLYTGMSSNVDARVAAHNQGRGAKYTSGRGPVELIYWEACEDRSTASVREAQIKKMTRANKEKLIHGK